MGKIKRFVALLLVTVLFCGTAAADTESDINEQAEKIFNNYKTTGGTVDGVRILQEETVTEMMADQQGKGGITAESPYGLCINRNDTLIEGTMVYGHQGISDAIVANVYYEPESRFVFVMITNGCKSGMNNRVCAVSRKMFTLMWENFGDADK